ncbi:hypothetical protein B7494_g3623 [Chlorociboria aeruginascens]|nr:hypothetical protein B7494_g3623 [Chlorociboria aeruginascens]
MASANKPSSAPRRKSTKGSLIVTCKLSPQLLQKFAPVPTIKPEESPSKEPSSPTSDTIPSATLSNGDVKSESNPNTPNPNGTPVPSSMPPPTEAIKKKGVKRNSAVALGPDAPPKVRGKPGPKKKARLEDGTIDHSSTPKTTTTGHKLGPKANQGAINAGLRALDRSGKPCRKWKKGEFTLKSFTGVVWGIPRWTAPPKVQVNGVSEDSTSGSSGKENKESSHLESDKSNSAVDVEMGSTASQNVNSPAPAQVPPVAAPTPSIAVEASA